MTYPANWRPAFAADLLLAPDSTATAVARTVGYNIRFPSAVRSDASRCQPDGVPRPSSIGRDV